MRYTVQPTRSDQVRPGDTILRHQTNPATDRFALCEVTAVRPAPLSQQDKGKDLQIWFVPPVGAQRTESNSTVAYVHNDTEVLVVLTRRGWPFGGRRRS